MPYGMSWGQYSFLLSSSLGSMLIGGQFVHLFFEPDLTIPDTPVPKPEPEIRINIVAPRGHRDDSAPESK